MILNEALSWNVPWGGGGQKSFRLTRADYKEIFGFHERGPLHRTPTFYGEPRWRLRAPDDREIVPNFIHITQTVQPRFQTLEGGHKFDMLTRGQNSLGSLAPDALRVTFQELGFGGKLTGTVWYANDGNRIRGGAFCASEDTYLELDLTSTTAAFQSRDHGRDTDFSKVDLTEITFDQFKQIAAAAAKKLAGRTGVKPSPPDYPRIIELLKEYRPLLFRDLPDDLIAAALRAKEKTASGDPGPTANLRDMARRVDRALAFMSEPVAGGAKPNPLITPQTKIKDAQDVIWEITDAIKDTLPDAAGKLIGWVGFFKAAGEKMVEIRDAVTLPAQAEAIYAQYREGRGPGTDEDAYSVYDRVMGTARHAQMVRSAPEFKNMSESQFTAVFRSRLEARYQMELLESARADLAARNRQVIEAIVAGADSKINAVHRACEELAR